MRKVLKILLQLLPLNFQNKILEIRNKFLSNLIIKKWENAGKPLLPPHQVKQKTIEYYQKL